MLYDALLTLDLPREIGPPLSTGFWEGLERWLFTGSWSRRVATVRASNAAVLASAYASLRQIGSRPALEIVDDAGELLDLGVPSEGWGDDPAPFVEALPERWTQEPCDFRVRASWRDDQLATVAVLRHTPRHDTEQAALSGAVRVLWAPQSTGAELEARLATAGAARRLAALLTLHGDRTVEALQADLAQRLGGRGTHRSRVLIPVEDGGGGFSEIYRGFPPEAIEAAAVVEEALTGWWPALSSSGIEGRVRDGQFVPVAEVIHAL